jgi:hypothetical protein
LFPPEAIQVVERSPLRVVIIDPPYYSAGAWILFFAVCVGLAASFLWYRGYLPPLAGMLLLVFLGLSVFGLYLMTSKRVISLSRTDGILRIEKGAFGMSHPEAAVPLDQIQKAIVENVRFAHSLVVVMKSGQAFSLGGSSDRQGYFGAAEAINALLGPG